MQQELLALQKELKQAKQQQLMLLKQLKFF